MKARMIEKNTRREFLKTAATATAAVSAANLFPATLAAQEGARGVAIILDPQEAAQKPVPWAAEQLRDALKSRGVAAEMFEILCGRATSPCWQRNVSTGLTSASGSATTFFRTSLSAFTAKAESPKEAMTSGGWFLMGLPKAEGRSRSTCTPKASIRR